MAFLECNTITKNYGKFEALKNVDIVFEENVIYGLLGRNGAGKTTLLNIIAGRLFPSCGEIKISGNTLQRGQISHEICLVSESNAFFKGLRIKEYLESAATYHKNWDWDFAWELMKVFKLNPEQKIKQLSRGMESLVSATIGFASRAPLTLFDEPMLGLDVIMRERFYKVLLKDYAENPRTIVMSTHLIDEISDIVEKVYIIEAGEVLLQYNMENLKSESFVISGKCSEVESFVRDKKVINMQTHGNVAIAAIFEGLSDEDIARLHKHELSVESLPLQKFFAYYVEGGK